MSFISSITITRRIGFGFGLLTVLLAVLGALSWGSLRGIERDLGTVAQISETSAAATSLDAKLAGLWPRIEAAMLAGRVGEVGPLLDEAKTAINASGLRGGEAALTAYADAVRQVAELSRAVAEATPTLAKLDETFGPAIKLVADHRKLMFDAEGVANIADLQADLNDGRRGLLNFIDLTGTGVTAASAATLEDEAKKLNDAWKEIQEETAKLVEGMNGSEEKEAFDKLTPAIATYQQTITALVPKLVSRAHLRLNQLAPARATLGDLIRSASESAQRDQARIMTATRETAGSATGQTLSLALGIVVVAVIIAVVVASSIVRPLKGITGAMEKVAAGELETEIPARGEKSEIGALAHALGVFRDNAVAQRVLEAEQREEQAAKEERLRKRDALTSSLDQTARALLGDVAKAAAELETTAKALSVEAERARGRSEEAAHASAEVTTNVQTVAAASEELEASIGEIARQADQGRQVADQATKYAQDGARLVAGLEDSSRKIGAVVAMINDIASQTNLLALNATIEAARAGDAGKGFAVVAGEVKNLAGQSGKATDEVAAQIQDIQRAADETVQAIKATAQVIEQIDQISTSIAGAVEQQSASTREIGRNALTAAQGAAAALDNIKLMREGTATTSTGSSNVLNAAHQMTDTARKLGEVIQTFLDEVREAS